MDTQEIHYSVAGVKISKNKRGREKGGEKKGRKGEERGGRKQDFK